MSVVVFLISLWAMTSVVFAASPEPTLLPYVKNEFQPKLGQQFAIPFYLPDMAKAEIELYTPDRDLIRRLASSDLLPPGEHHLMWDGKDAQGGVVPDEAYFPVLHVLDQQGNRTSFRPPVSGGEVIQDVAAQITAGQHVSLQLPAPARVLSRVGIKGGPMLRTLANWQPKNKGQVVLRWDGLDADKLHDIRKNKDLSVMTRAYRLPDFAILVSGDIESDYRRYRQGLEISEGYNPDLPRPLERKGKRIARHYYIAKDINLNPPVQLALGDDCWADQQRQRIVNQRPCSVHVDLDALTKAQLQTSLYEIAFFIDDQFVSEQEQGYVPFSWRWLPNGLQKGEHILTVNVSGLRGEVGVRSIKFLVD